MPPPSKPPRIVLLASRFNLPISEGLVAGATEALRRWGVPERCVEVVWAPGSFELPVVAAGLCRGPKRPDGIVALGALIRGQTPQYLVLAQAVAHGLMEVSVRAVVPISFGIIVAETAGHAWARATAPGAQGSAGAGTNRGAEAAAALLETLRLFEALKGRGARRTRLAAAAAR
jgi:6,7-dimethyl-8-ribityllumazine synthase